MCEGCGGGFRCYNESSPCFLQYCGIYPGTGPQIDGQQGDEDMEKERNVSSK